MSAHPSKTQTVVVSLTIKEVEALLSEVRYKIVGAASCYQEKVEALDMIQAGWHLESQRKWEQIQEKLRTAVDCPGFFAGLKAEVAAVGGGGDAVGGGGDAVAAAGGAAAAAGAEEEDEGAALLAAMDAVEERERAGVPSWETVRRSLAAASDALQSVGASRR